LRLYVPLSPCEPDIFFLTCFNSSLHEQGTPHDNPQGDGSL
jgi:hypothetical protein